MNVFELEASLKLDRKEYERGIRDAQDSAKDLSKSFSNVESDAEAMAETFGEATSDMASSFEDVVGAVDSADFSSSFDDISSGADDTATSFEDMASTAQGASDSTISSLGGIKGAEDEVSEGSDSMADMFGGGIEKMQGIIEKAGLIGAIGMVVGAIAKIGSEMTEAAAEFDKGSDNIIFATGLMGDEADKLTQAYHRAWLESKNLDEDWDQASATGGLITTLYGNELSEEQQTSLYSDVSTFANITGTNTYADFEQLNSLIGAWQGNVRELPGIMNGLYDASAKSSASVEDLMTALTNGHPAFEAFGLTMEDSTEILSAYAYAGGNVTELSNSLKYATRQLAEQGIDANGMWEDMTEAVSGCTTVQEALQVQVGNTGLTMQDIFGRNAQTMVQTLMNARSSADQFNISLSETPDYMKRVELESISGADNVALAARTASGTAQNIVNSFLDIVFGTSTTMEQVGKIGVDAIYGTSTAMEATEEDMKQFHAINTQGMVATTRASGEEAKNALISSANEAQSDLANRDIKFGGSVTVPSFSVSGIFDAIKGAVPNIGVSTKQVGYARGYHEAIALDRPTIFGYGNGASLVGGDGSGTEIVSGEAHLIDLIDNSVAKSMSGVEALLQELIAVTAQGQNVYLDGKQIANSVSKVINKQTNMRSAV